MISFVLVLYSIVFCQSAPTKDEITSLPGYYKDLPSKHYSGYLDIQGDKHVHYWFVESQSNPSNDPVVLWLNGGPGASSTGYGFFNELGTFHCDDDSLKNGSLPNPYLNPLSWDKIANMIYFEHPAGVGYSYCDDPSCRWNDHSQAKAGLATIQAFFNAFPEYKKNDFYIFGESYGGIYVPTIAYEVMSNDKSINIKGIGVGNGCTGHSHGSSTSAHFLGGHGLYPLALYDQIIKECNWDDESSKCRDLVHEAYNYAGDYYSYNIYDTCGDDQLSIKNNRYRLWDKNVNASDNPLFPRSYPCGMEKATTVWMNHPDAIKAMHVNPWQKWRPESPIHYSGGDWDSYDVYPDLIGNIRVMIYNGDADPCVPYTGDEIWTKDMVAKLGLSVEKDWHTWSVDDVVAGYNIKWSKDFQFVTVKNAGHMVPQYKPAQAFSMFQRFLKNEDL